MTTTVTSMSFVGGLNAALDVAFAVDIDEYFGDNDEALADQLVALRRQQARLDALVARLVARYDRRKVWAADGSKSVSAAIARDAGLSQGSARQLVARARKLETMPLTAAALATGEISTDHVDVLSRANQTWRNSTFTDHEATLVDMCRRLRFAHVRRAVSYWCQRADEQAAEDAADRIDLRRSCAASTGWDGEVLLRAALPAIGGAEFVDELARLERQLYLDDKKAGRRRTVRQRRADALVEMASRSRSSKPGGLRPRPLITILVGEDTFRRTCELADGTVLTPGQVVPTLADADIERIVFDGPDNVVATSPRRRFSGALRRAIEVRDRHCQHRSVCDQPVTGCDADHIIPSSHGGETSQTNGRLLCPTHNRNHTRRNATRRRRDHDGRSPPAGTQ